MVAVAVAVLGRLAKVLVVFRSAVVVVAKVAVVEKMVQLVKMVTTVMATVTDQGVYTVVVLAVLVVVVRSVSDYNVAAAVVSELFGDPADSFPQPAQEICNGVL
jgi:hypothetical protein